MTNKFQVNGQNPFLTKKIAQSDKNQAAELQKKQLRVLQLCFQSNLNKFVRKNKECFNGDIQVPPKSSSFTPVQYQTNKKVLDNIEVYVQRLSRAMIMKNSYLQKQHKSFELGYRESNATPALQNPERQQEKQQEKQKEYAIIYDGQRTQENQFQKFAKGKSKNIVIRPQSATVTNRKVDLKQLNENRQFQRPLSSQFSRDVKKRNTINLKNVDFDRVNLQKNQKKVPLFRQSLGDIYDFQKYEQEQVYIRKKIIPLNVFGHQNKFSRSGNSVHSRLERSSLAKNFDNFNAYKNNAQKIKLQNKIMMVNTVLAFNLSQTQGYKPKSKCWTNPII